MLCIVTTVDERGDSMGAVLLRHVRLSPLVFFASRLDLS